ncbi:MAG: UDP-3-O-[3-hydroxymyristoyl] N-acetylglucosamine deacetylase [Candidatus Saganbacteria bacterium]|nr:UDP-3-O-[3-hydroxymyristoyl] N-acetylglucosamine deacetylase [Candidatus Saganbacteria bacterium]
MNQLTINNSFVLSGIGIHSGENTSITIHPAAADSGISFSYRNNVISLNPNNISGDQLATSLGKITMVEHLLAAIAGLSLSNLLIECSSGEIPILDGSSLPFVEALEKAGIVSQENDFLPISLKEALRVEDDDKWIVAEPADSLSIEFSVYFPVIGKQSFLFDGTEKSFKKDIAPARTFGYEKDLEELHKNGFAKGASLENALGISEKGYMNKPRFENEPVRHKLLDLIGDLALLGRPLNAKIRAYKSSHKLNQELVRRIN